MKKMRVDCLQMYSKKLKEAQEEFINLQAKVFDWKHIDNQIWPKFWKEGKEVVLTPEQEKQQKEAKGFEKRIKVLKKDIIYYLTEIADNKSKYPYG